MSNANPELKRASPSPITKDFEKAIRPLELADKAEPNESLEQIRSILFGSQVERLRGQIADLRLEMSAEINRVRTHLLERLDLLEDYFRDEYSECTKNATLESQERKRDIANLESASKATQAHFSEEITKVTATLRGTHHELRQLVLDRAKAGLENDRNLQEKLSAMISNGLADLKNQKVDRHDMRSFLAEFSQQFEPKSEA